MRNVTLLVAALCAGLLLHPADSSLVLQNELEPTNSEEVGVNRIRAGQHECSPGICCPQYHTCLWSLHRYYCCYYSLGKWNRKQPAFPC